MSGWRAVFLCGWLLCGWVPSSGATWFFHLKASPYCLSSSAQLLPHEALLTLAPCRGTVDQGFTYDNGHLFSYRSAYLAATLLTTPDAHRLVLRPYVAQDLAQTIHYEQQQLRVDAATGQQCLVPLQIAIGTEIHNVPCSSKTAVWEELIADFTEREIHSEHQYCLSSGRLLAIVPVEKRAVVLRPCRGAPGQRWHYRYGDGTLELLLGGHRLCLSADQQLLDRVAVVLLPCQHWDIQRFDFFGRGNIGSRLLPQYHVAAVTDEPEGAVYMLLGSWSDVWQQTRGAPENRYGTQAVQDE